MLKSKVFKGKKFIILGMGISGQSVYNSLSKSSAIVSFWDDNFKVRNSLKTKGYNICGAKEIKQAEYIIPSPGIKLNGAQAHPLIKKAKVNKIKLISELDLFQNYLNQKKHPEKIKIIAITGTNGKSTLVSLLNFIIKKNQKTTVLAGNIGKPIFNSKPIESGIIILELSSYQLEITKSFKPDIACIINLSIDHIDRHGTFKKYADAKSNIFQNLDKDQFGLCCSNNTLRQIINKKYREKKDRIEYVNIPSKTILDIKNNDQIDNEKFIYAVNILNRLNIGKKQFLNNIKSFRGLPFRTEVILAKNNLKIINDSKSTNFDSLIYALSKYENAILICGGILKDKKFKVLDKHLKKVKKIYVFGEKTKPWSRYFSKIKPTISVRTLDDVVPKISEDLKKGKYQNILFSPGASSFDQYQNFEDRGNHFNKLFRRLI